MPYGHHIEYAPARAAYWTAQSVYSDTVLTPDTVGNAGASFATLSFSRQVPSGLREDLATITFCIGKTVTAGTWSQLSGGDKALAETSLSTWFTSMTANVSPEYAWREIRWHDWLINESKLGPADRVTAKSVAGANTAVNRMPDQDACTVTFKTAGRKHWGRVYLPGLSRLGYDMTYGRFSTTTVDNMATYMHTLQANLVANSQELLVGSRKFSALLEVASISCDDVVDIQRRRRAKQANYHKEFTS